MTGRRIHTAGDIMRKPCHTVTGCCEYHMNDHPEALYQSNNFVSEEYNIKEYAASFK